MAFKTPDVLNHSGKFFIIPQDKRDRDIIEAVDSKSRYDMNSKYDIHIEWLWQCNTIATSVVDTLVSMMAMHLNEDPEGGFGLNFANLFELVVSVRQSEAEKVGNINLIFRPSDIALDITKGKNIEEIDLSGIIDDTISEEMKDFYTTVNKHAVYKLALTNNTMLAGPEYVSCIVTFIFFKNLFSYLTETLKVQMEENPDEEKHVIGVNFNDRIEILASMDENMEISFYMTQGHEAKLGIKGDDKTEDTMGDDDDYPTDIP